MISNRCGQAYPKKLKKNKLAMSQKINLNIKIIFWMWLGIHEYIFDRCGQEHLDMLKVILIIKSAISQD